MSEHKLVYADELYNTLANKLRWLMKHSYPIYLEVGENIKEAIDEQIIAYDVGKIVEELEETSADYCREYGYPEEENILYLPDAIEIVERGGVEYELCENK